MLRTRFFLKIVLFICCLLPGRNIIAQILPQTLSPAGTDRCYTAETIREAIAKDPGIVEEWRRNGERQYEQYLQRSAMGRGGLADTITIPVVFHLIDEAAKLAWITDRSIYDQVELLNQAYNGVKVEKYKDVIPKEIYSRKGRVPIRFVLARTAPDGSLTSGIERRVNKTPGRKDIKSNATGGLDAWDTDQYLNVWVGTFSGDDDGLLGVATFPFITTEGPQGVVIGIATIPYTTNVSRSYYPIYNEGATLIHEVGHFFYLWHAFGDLSYCNNEDFRIQPGWPLPAGAGPEGDDTPEQKKDNNLIFGNPSMNFSDGCTGVAFGEMYGNFMNYFDDRAMFMFSDGQRKRVEGCIQLYRQSLANSHAGGSSMVLHDAYVVSATPYGTPERKTHVRNQVPLTVKVRNYGNVPLQYVTLNLLIDNNPAISQIYTLNLAPGQDADVELGTINAAGGNKKLTIFTSGPNGQADAFSANDTLESFINIVPTVVTAPFKEDFSGGAFPPAGWTVWNPNGDNTWAHNSTSGYTQTGSASIQFRTFSGSGQLDELVMPAIDLGVADSAILNFRLAYAVYNQNIVSTWDGLEVHVSNDDGQSYHLAYKKTGKYLSTVAPQTQPFDAPPTAPERWRDEKVNLSPYLNGRPLLVKFRGTNARGNNLYIDDVDVSIIVSYNRDVQVTAITGLPEYICSDMPAPRVSFRSNGKDVIEKLTIHYMVDDQPALTTNWTGALQPNNTTTAPLTAFSGLAAGEHVLTVYTSKPNGLNDEDVSNDTMRYVFYSMGTVVSPLSESFENPGFPPNQWVLQQNGNGHSWERTTSAASDGNASAVLRNYNFNMSGKSDNLISPVITGNSIYDSLFLTFDYAYAPGANYPGAPGNLEDTLEVKVTTDCGQTFTTIFKKFGNEMSTVSDPMVRKNSAFVAAKDDWQRVAVYLTPITNKNDLQVFFTSRGNNRNNVYIDNVKVYGVIVPALLKEKGYLLYPTPFQDQFIIRNFEQPVDLKSIQIYDALGRLIWHQQYNSNAQKQIPVNASGWPSGIYTVKMNFGSATIIDRVVKQ